jgi:hypothetical protein
METSAFLNFLRKLSQKAKRKFYDVKVDSQSTTVPVITTDLSHNSTFKQDIPPNNNILPKLPLTQDHTVKFRTGSLCTRSL